MPRKARIDAPGAVHHIIVRGIERGIIHAYPVDTYAPLASCSATDVGLVPLDGVAL